MEKYVETAGLLSSIVAGFLIGAGLAILVMLLIHFVIDRKRDRFNF